MAKKNKRYARDNLVQRFVKQKQRNILAQPGPRDVVIVLDHLKPNFNIGKIFRTAYAFGIKKIYLVGIEVFDPAPAKGSFRSVPAVFDETFENTYMSLRDKGYAFYVLMPEADIPLQEVQLPQKSAFVFGHEEFGFSFDLSSFDGLQPVGIQQVGRVESLNVSIAASIAMYEYTRQHPVAIAR